MRHAVCEYMAKEKARFSASFESMDAKDDNFNAYLARMRCAGEWGGGVEIMAAEEVYDR